MVLRSKSVGEQDVADQQGAFLCREDLTFVGSSFFGSYSICLLDVYVWIWNSAFEVILYVEKLLDKSQSILNSENYVFRVLRFIDVILVVNLINTINLFEATFPEFVRKVEANKHAFRSCISSIFNFLMAANLTFYY